MERTSPLYAAKRSIVTSTWSTASSTVLAVTNKLYRTLLPLCKTLTDELSQLSTIQSALFLTIFLLGLRLGSRGPFWKRFSDAIDIPNRFFGPKAKRLRGHVLKVTDGDTLRFLHRPLPWSPKTLIKGQKMSEFALPIRICTMDTPETPKFGKPGQPFGKEAKETLAEYILDKTISIRLLQKDQYGRAVAQVFVPGKNKGVDELMLRKGLAEVYQGMGAVYGPLGKERYLELEDDARQAKIGIWSQTKRESAAEYKKRTK